MTNVSAPGKVEIRQFLFATAISELERNGWKVERIPRAGKGSLRLITKGAERKKISIRTSQDTWIAFPRNETNTGFATLEDVDVVIAASLAEKHDATTAKFHWIEGDDMRARFNRLYEAKAKANHVIPEGRGIWLSLYDEEKTDPVSLVGAGVGRPEANTLFAEVSIPGVKEGGPILDDEAEADDEAAPAAPAQMPSPDDGPLTIPEAKRRLAMTFGVSPDQIKITVEG